MFTPRQARQGLALLSGIVLWTMSATAEPPPVQADASLTAGEGDQDRGVARPRNPAAGGDAPPVAPPQADRRNAAAAPETPGPAAPVDDAAAFGSAARQSLNEYLIRDRAIAIQLTTAAQDVAARRYDDAVTALQAVCDAASDVFVWPEDGRPPIPACALAADLFRQLPPEILAEYERRQGADARRLLTEFERTSRFECERELLRRYEFTAAGAEVLLRAAERAFDRGEFADAARGYQRYFSHPVGQRTATAETCLRAEVARELAAAGGIVVRLPEFDGSRPVHRAGRAQTGGAWRKELLESLCRRPPPATAVETDWRLAMGNGQAHRPVTGSLPTLEPLWSASHEEPRAVETAELQTVSYETAPRGSDLLEHWVSTRHERRLPCAGANFALVDGERLLVRDFSGVSARDLRTGAVLWQYPCAAGLVQRAVEIQAASKASATPPAPFDPTPLFNEYFAQNSVLGMLASDGERVYCVDLIQDPPAGAGEGGAAGSLNRLVALALHEAGQTAGTLVWQATGEGWCFLGPPLPAHDRLYVIAERDSMVSLLALDARTGNTIWSQPISLVDAAVADDPQRARQACSPTMAGGILVCPTQLGTIVGVDARTGTLAWVYSYAEANGPSQPWRKSRAFDREHGTPEFPNLAAIVGGTVLVLAPQSSSVHCLDLQTGTQRWTVDRDEAHYAATVGDDLVLLVGPRTCVARRFSNGEEVWRQPIDTPTGRGLAIGDRFLLPTADGRILSLDLKTGQIAPDLLPRLDRKRSVALRAADGVDLPSDPLEDEPIPISGNLLCSGEFIVACSPSGVAVYPQAQVMLDAIRDESRTGLLSAAGWLERGELELRLGDVLAAERSLISALQTNPSPRTRAVAESRLRELLYAEISRNADTQARLAALDGLCVEPADRARFLSERLQRELQARGVDAAHETAIEIARLSVDYPVPMDARGAYVVLPARRAAAALARSAGGNADRELLLRQLPARTEAGCSLSDIAASVAWSATVRDERAARVQALIDGDQFQPAELLLIAETRQSDPDRRRSATDRLAALWMRCGLSHDAERLLAEDDLTGRKEDASRSLIRAEIDQRMIRGESDEARVASALDELLERNRDYTRQPAGSRVLFDRGLQGTPERYSSLSVVDTSGPRLVADLAPLPPRVWRVGDSYRYDAGHFLPIAGNGDVHGISLLEGRIVWTATPETHRTGDKVALGPFGPEFCILQAQETVTALDPADGRVLWRRTDIPYDAGLERDDLAMFADDTALVIFNADFTTYRVLDPRSGDLLSSGELEPSAEPRRRGWCLGRRLLYVNAQKTSRLRLWDPLQAEFALDVPCEGRCLVDPGLGDGLAAILNGRELFVLDARDATIVWSTRLTEAEAAAARQVRAVRDGDRFCIHVEHDVTNSPSSQATHDISGVPNVPLQGTLYVVDLRSLKHWSRVAPRCNLLLFPNDRLPVLVTLGRTREGETDQGTCFVMEVIDAATGVTLGKRANLTRTSKLLLHSRYEAEQGLLLLRGADSEIAVRLER